ncbi:hypothetical protein JXA34_03415 [Patescibacteria group bacterium]|nr:hypothetical protein [Patescibacteria group bacterium]
MSKGFKYSLLIITTIFFFLYIGLKIFPPGYIIHIDVTEGLSVDKLYQRYIYTYSNDIGESLAEQARIPLFYLVFGIYELADLPDEDYIKVKILVLMLLTFLVYLTTVSQLIKFLDKETPHEKYTTKYILPAFLGAFYYLTNYWFTNRLMHFYLFFSSVTIPITFYYIFTYLYSEKFLYRNLLSLIVVLSIFTATPHTVLFEGLIITTLTAVFLFHHKFTTKQKLSKLLGLALFTVFYILANSYWLLPYFATFSKPDAIVSETVVEFLAKNSQLGNSVRLMGYWLTDLEDYFLPLKSVAFLQEFFTLIPLFLFGIALIKLRRERRIIAALILLLGSGVLLASFTPLSKQLYYYLMFYSPIKFIGWLFREIDKLGIILAFVYSLVFSLLFFYLGNRSKRSIPILVVLYLGVMANNLYFLNKTLNDYYLPQEVPKEFEQAIELIDSDKDEFNVAWYPGVPQPYWSSTKEVRFKFSNLISPKPAITTRSDMMNYLHYLFKEEHIYYINMGQALDRVGVKYLVIRKDESVFDKFLYDDRLETQTSLEKILSTANLAVYKNKEFTGLSKFYDEQLTSNYGLDTLIKIPGLGIMVEREVTMPNTELLLEGSSPNFELSADGKYITKKEVPYDGLTTFIDYTDKPSNIALSSTQLLLKDNRKIDILLKDYRDRFIYPADFTTKKDDGNPGYWKLGSLENLTHAEVDLFFSNMGLEINQFDYENGVVVARDGWQKAKEITRGRALYFNFSNHPNLDLSNNDITYYSQADDFKYFWNIIRSDKFTTVGVRALQIDLISNIDEDLIPHFKIYAYDNEGNLLDINFMYPDLNNKVHAIIKLPPNTAKCDFSIWTLSKSQDYGYEVEDLSIQDISNNVEPVTLSFEHKSSCTENCEVFARLLKSNISGMLEIMVNDIKFEADTKIDNDDEREEYIWYHLGNVEQVGDIPTIRLINIEGFNSVNALLFLNQDEYNATINEAEYLPPQVLKLRDTTVKYPQVYTRQLNPTKYEITIKDANGEEGVLAFSKPYSQNWVLDGKKTELVNGYINGWKFDELKNGTYTVEYAPQEHFYTGVEISIVSLGLAVVYLVLTKVVTVSVAKSTSHG